MKDLAVVTTFEEDISTIKDITTKAFLVTGSILSTIQEDKKYKEVGYKTFAEAVEVELGLNKSRAYQLIDASVAYHNLSTIVDFLPTAESQLRPIAKLLPEQQIEVWKEVAKDKVPTAKEVQEIVNTKFPKEKKNISKEGLVVAIPKVSEEKLLTVTMTVAERIQMSNSKALIVELNESVKNKDKQIEEYIHSMQLLQEKYTTMVNRVKELEDIINDIALAESLQFQASLLPEEILLERTVVYNFVKEHANSLMKLRLEEKVFSDSILFDMFLTTRNIYLEANEAATLPYDILHATGIKQHPQQVSAMHHL